MRASRPWHGVVREEDSLVARTIFEAVGRVIPVEERLMDAVTGLSGSGPAYVFLALEALADGGVQDGIALVKRQSYWPLKQCWAQQEWFLRPAPIPQH